jgi:PKD repeat protein/phosphodiesterase/alkaline phosphatase D-like protein
VAAADFSTGSTNFGTGSDATYSVASSDLDGDGDIDLLVGNNNAQNVVQLSDGSGNFVAGGNFGTGSDATRSIAVGDVDGDGDVDVVVANFSQQNVVYVNDGSGNLNAGTSNFGSGTDASQVVALGDLDADGDLDIIVGDWSIQDEILLNNGSGVFSAGSNGYVSGFTSSIAIGDIDSDGDLDILVSDASANGIEIAENDGTGSIGGGSGFSGGSSDIAQSLDLGDVDGDGDLDIAAGFRNSQQNQIWLNAGLGQFPFSSVLNFGTGSDNTYAVKLGDLDGDGDLDVVSSNSGQQSYVYLNTGGGTISGIGRNLGAATGSVTTMSLADLDGDGDLDIAVGNNGQQNVVYLNQLSSPTPLVPTENNPGASKSTNLSATFSENISVGTSSTFVAHGSMSGKRAGAYGGGGTQTPSFDPSADFHPGEEVEVVLTSGLQTTSGLSAEPYVWKFTVAGGVAAADFANGSASFGSSDATQSLAAGDVDADGDLDIAVGNTSNQQNVIYVNDGSGDFSTSTNFGTGTESSWSVGFADVDGDGDLDVGVGNNTGGSGPQNVVYLNDGSGNFSGGSKNFGTGTDPTRVVTFGDVDGDGDLDVAVGNTSAAQSVVYKNDGSGNFTAGTSNFGGASDHTLSAVFTDVDNDGDLDVAMANSSNQQNTVQLNDGNGNFTAGSINIGSGTENTNFLSPGDVDGDGDIDFAVGNSTTQQSYIELNDGNGNFTAGTINIETTSEFTRSYLFRDADGDGDADLFIGNGGQQNNVLLNDGSANFSVTRPFGTGTESTSSLVVGDMDGDGDLDVAAGNTGSEQNVVYFNQLPPPSTLSPIVHSVNSARSGNVSATFSQNMSVGAAATFVIQGGQTGKRVGVYGGGGTTTIDFNPGSDFTPGENVQVSFTSGLQTTTGIPATPQVWTFNAAAGAGPAQYDILTSNIGGSDFTTGVRLGDVDGDGDLDIAVGNQNSQQNVTYLNDGAGEFTAGTKNFGTGSDDTREVHLVDVDGDGDLDVGVSNSSLQNVVYLNSGSGDFTGGSKNFGSDNTNTLAFGDVDGDGDPDVAVGNSSAQNTLHLNDGTGSFGSSQNFGSGTDGTKSLQFADIDLDGDLDLAVGNDFNEQNVVYMNDGTGSFGTSKNFGTGADGTNFIALGDIDNDADVDILVGNGSGQQSAAYLNDGSGNFTAGTKNFGATEPTETIAIGDLDGDGDLDVAVGNNNSNQNAVYLNDGSGNFTAGTKNFGTGTDPTDFLDIGDVDGDGDLDIAAGNLNAQNVLYFNQDNIAPVATVQTVSTDEDTDLAITLAGTDANSDPLTAIISTLPGSGTLYQTTDGTTRGPPISAVPTTVTDASKRVIYGPVQDLNGNGIGSFGLKVNDGIVDSPEGAVTLNVTSVNDATTLTSISDPSAILEDASQQTVNLTGITTGASNESQTLTITSASADNTLLPDPAVTYTSPQTGGSLLYEPVPDANGTVLVTVMVKDDGGTANAGVDSVVQSFTVTITAVNDTPTLTDIIDPAAILEDAGEQTVNIVGIATGAGNETQVLTVTVSSSNTALIPNPTVTYTSPGATGTLTYTPLPGASGAATITVTVSDDGGTANGGVDTVVKTFDASVTPVNDAPTLDAISDPAALLEDAGEQSVNLSGITTGAANETQVLTVTASSSNPGLIPDPTVTYTSPGATGTLTYTPVSGVSGTATITVTVTDDGGTVNGGVDSVVQTFGVAVNAANDVPTLSDISDPASILEDAGEETVNLSGIGTGAANETQVLIVTAVSSNTSLIPNPAVTYTSPGATGTLTYTPVADENGTSTITVTVTDDGGTANGGVDAVVKTFDVVVTSVNEVPTLSDIADPSSILENTTQQTVNLTGIGTGTTNEAQTLTVTATSNNTPLIADPVVTYTSPNATGTLSYTPVANAFGTAAVTVSVTDDGGTANGGLDFVSKTFQVTVDPAPPVAAFGPSTSGGIVPTPVTFTDQSTGTVTSWAWTFGEGGTSTEQSPGHVYVATGTYTVSLTVTGPGGTDNETKTNLINVVPPPPPPPNADFTASATAGVSTLDVTFTDATTGNVTSRSWNFGDGNTSTDLNPSHTYGAPGVFTVSLTASGPGGANIETKGSFIVVSAPNQPPSIAAIGDQTAVQGIPIAFDVDVTDETPGTVVVFLSAHDAGLIPTVDVSGHTITLTPNGTVFSTTVQVQARDAQNVLSNVQTVNVSWTPPPNGPPVFVGALFTPTDGATGLQPLVTLNWHAADPESDPLVYDLLIGPSAGQLAVVSADMIAKTYQHQGALGETWFWLVVVKDGTAPPVLSPVMSYTIQSDTTPPAFTVGPIVEGIDNASASVRWRTNEEVTGTVHVTDGTTPQDVASGASGLDHVVALENLDAATAYTVTVTVEDGFGNPTVSVDVDFTTLMAPDTAAPLYVSFPSVSVTHNSALLSWELNEAADGLVNYGTTSGSLGLNAAAGQAAPLISAELTGLASNTTYFYQTVSTDLAGNVLTGSEASFTTLSVPDVTPPVVVEGPGVQGIGEDQASVLWKTDGAALSRVMYGDPAVPGSGLVTPLTGAASSDHFHLLSGLTADTVYDYRVISIDAAGNADTSGVNSFQTLSAPDTAPPVFTSQPVYSNVLFDGLTGTWETNEASTSELVAQASGADPISRVVSDPVTVHQVQVTGMTANTVYVVVVRSRDAAGNLLEKTMENALTLSLPDTTPPEITGPPVVLRVTESQAQIVWETHEPADGYVEVGTLQDLSDAVRVGSSSLSVKHNVTVTNLASATVHYYRVSSTDLSGNGPTLRPEVGLPLNFQTLAAPDVLAPFVVWGPIAVAPNESGAQIQWTTDESSDGRVRYATSAGALSDLQSIYAAQFQQVHEMSLSGLLSSQIYFYQVLSKDGSGNGPTISEIKQFTTLSAPDTQGPVVTSGPTQLSVTAKRALIGWETDEPSNSEVEVSTVPYDDGLSRADRQDQNGAIIVSRAEAVQSHRVRVTGLENSTFYWLAVHSTDAAGNLTTVWQWDFFNTLGAPDNTPPIILEGPSVTYASDQQATVAWVTDEPATNKVVYGALGNFLSSSNPPVTGPMATSHSLTIPNLSPGTRYLFRIVSTDGSGNVVVAGTLQGFVAKVGVVAKLVPGKDGGFSTATDPDLSPPVILSGPHVVSSTSSALTLEWVTDESSDSVVDFGKEEATTRQEQGQDVQAHRVVLTNLLAGQSYQYKVLSTDPSGNGPVESRIFIGRTASVVDTIAPRISVSPLVIELTDRAATLVWATDEGSTTFISYGVEGMDRQKSSPDYVTAHRVTLTNLEPETTYRYKVRAVDGAANGPVEGEEQSFTTAAMPDVALPEFVTEPRAEAITDRSAAIVWDTDELSDSGVRFVAGEGAVLDDESPVIGSARHVVTHEVALTNLEPNTEYVFVVESTDRSENGPAVSEVKTFRTAAGADEEAPGIPGELIARGAVGEAVLTWRTVEDADVAGYDILRAIGEGELSPIVTLVADAFYRDDGLETDKTYRYAVRAVDQAGNASDLSNNAQVTADGSGLPGIPESIGWSGDADKPVLEIKNAESPLELTYKFEVAADEAFEDRVTGASGVPQGLTTTTWRVDISLEDGKTYYWRAKASDGVFEGSFMDAASFTVLNRPGDFDADFAVGFSDFVIFAEAYDTLLGHERYRTESDMDKDGDIDFTDFLQFARVYGTRY